MNNHWGETPLAKTAPVTDLKPKPVSPMKTPKTMKRNTLSLLSYKRPTGEMLLCNISTFGKDAPKIAIGCSRPKSVFPDQTPGPGHYDPTDPGESRKIHHHISKTVEKPRATDTANIDFINYRIFPSLAPATIPKTSHQEYFSFDKDIPGPSFIPPSTLTSKGHKIEPIRPTRNPGETAPGPGYYNPTYEKTKPAYVSKTTRNTDHFPGSTTPGPGTYNPNFDAELTVQPKFTIGNKVRNKRRRKNDPPEVPRGKLIGVAQFVFPMDPSMNEDDVFRYIASHPQLKFIVNEIMEYVLINKPDDPLKFIHELFYEMKLARKQVEDEQHDSPDKDFQPPDTIVVGQDTN
ncbi:hypothetical protein TVAG_106370 [Trichomonas vaginalis G3]|uniref:Uncharacterized protein n=1 Tax=Trichomonas vaginalis (strain ATCC PRA-98 / G3) TaxID=412133 RepID=A2E6C9_TRIV3|nr:Dimerization-anchoring domain of cAMP-dependent PK regulatory subunit family [Trichomonas vaginalis G3]EAY11742.1 hypothetical protein TVAG_106370 [Trichomonas vaginalis G3]KAI5540593.1 Dimerization-anchoring domain of cAMP-dependent PK regulatory subunit family [Trichomonas vaginalis G3]|eukprot:XP_001323965.1 hypothetical protein [Trichomonas vaginalis G3]